jgi:hypothetical protein
MATEKRASPRVREHVNRLLHAGFDTQKFFDALVAIREDATLPQAHREALYKLIAMESFVWYLEALRNEPIDRLKLLAEAKRIQEEHSAAIRASAPGERAAELAKADLSKTPSKPPVRPSVPPAITKNERPPKK